MPIGPFLSFCYVFQPFTGLLIINENYESNNCIFHILFNPLGKNCHLLLHVAN